MTDTIVLFQNQMRKSNWAFILLAFALAVPFIVLQGMDIGLAILISGGLAICACAFAFALIAWMGRRNIGVLRLEGTVLEAEMLSAWGPGKKSRFPVAETEDWRLTKLHPTLRFRHAGTDFSLPLHGAKTDWPTIRQIAPNIREIPR